MTVSKKTEKATDAFETMTTMTTVNPEAFKQGYEKMAESMSTFADFQKDSYEAFVASAGAFAKGFEKLASEQATFVKAALEDTAANAKAMASAKSPQEAIELNSEFARSAVENNLGQVSKAADLWIETTKETVEPLSARYSEMVEKIQAFRP